MKNPHTIRCILFGAAFVSSAFWSEPGLKAAISFCLFLELVWNLGKFSLHRYYHRNQGE